MIRIKKTTKICPLFPVCPPFLYRSIAIHSQNAGWPYTLSAQNIGGHRPYKNHKGGHEFLRETSVFKGCPPFFSYFIQKKKKEKKAYRADGRAKVLKPRADRRTDGFHPSDTHISKRGNLEKFTTSERNN